MKKMMKNVYFSFLTSRCRMFITTRSVHHLSDVKSKSFHKSCHHQRKEDINHITSSQVRKAFLDYYIQRDHVYVHSSPVLPKQDKSLLFVNSGMNQFKPLFLGTAPLGSKLLSLKRATNTQKCIRVGGKHNDIDDVGKDGYHHTFFEMLGNWSFGDYFKKEACSMAWELLTEVFNISPKRLYVTYFGGDKSLGLEADMECREIWLSLGVPPDRIFPFGMEHNFWEMGNTGPCGPCTEIHYDHSGSESPKSINSGLPDVIEVFNLVFIQYERQINGILKKLETCHVDTGMGLERLTAILQNSQSNYDTDLFTPIFDAIQQGCRVRPYLGKYGADDRDGIDTAYRILADHSRMITAAITDGVLPDEFDAGNCLRRIIKKAIWVADNHLKAPPHLLGQLVPAVVDILGETFPEMTENANKVIEVIDEEEERMRKHIANVERKIEKIAHKTNNNILEASDAYQLYMDSGLPEELIEQLARKRGLSLDQNLLSEKISSYVKCSASKTAKVQARITVPSSHVIESLQKAKVPLTRDEFKYNYTSCDSYYRFDPMVGEIVAIISKDNNIVNEMNEGESCWVVVNQTNFYSESGGQASDIGDICGQSYMFKVADVQACQGYVFHWGTLEKGTMKKGAEAHLAFDKLHRVRCMRNHTATHILQSCLKKIMPTDQKSSFIGPSYLRFGFNAKKALDQNQIADIESSVTSIIKQQLDITRTVLPLNQALSIPNVVTFRNELYPDVVNVISIGKNQLSAHFSSDELCCGTHLHNTAHISSFVITSQRKESQTERSVYAVTGKQAQAVIGFGQKLLDDVLKIKNTVLKQKAEKVCDINVMQGILTDVRRIRTIIRDTLVPLGKQMEILQRLDGIETESKTLVRSFTKRIAAKQLQSEIEETLKTSSEKYLVHRLHTSGDSSYLIKLAMDFVNDRPAMIFTTSFVGNQVLCYCTVPEAYVTNRFTAEKWMSPVVDILKGKCSKPQDPKLFSSLVGQDTSQIQEAIKLAQNFAQEFL